MYSQNSLHFNICTQITLSLGTYIKMHLLKNQTMGLGKVDYKVFVQPQEIPQADFTSTYYNYTSFSNKSIKK